MNPRTLALIAAVLLVVAWSAVAADHADPRLSSHRRDAPATRKPLDSRSSVALAPDPAVLRQGGDTMADAILLSLPVDGLTGSTVGYTDDYDEVCPYDGSTAPDVVYRLAPPMDMAVVIDMIGSTYDTKIYVYREDLTVVACNDDYYPDYVSRLDRVDLAGDVKYFLVIDGYGGDAGEYVLTIDEHEPCDLVCPAGGEPEGEPPLVDGYEDWYNGGCGSPQFGNPFGTITSELFCGRSGWYIDPYGLETRDTDWFEVTIPYAGFLEIVGDADYETYLHHVGPLDCQEVDVIDTAVLGPCSENALVVLGDVGETVWLWVGPTTYDGPLLEYDYVLLISMPVEPIATESRSWTAVKGLFH